MSKKLLKGKRVHWRMLSNFSHLKVAFVLMQGGHKSGTSGTSVISQGFVMVGDKSGTCQGHYYLLVDILFCTQKCISSHFKIVNFKYFSNHGGFLSVFLATWDEQISKFSTSMVDNLSAFLAIWDK